MSVKNVEAVIPAPNHHYVGDGFRVHNFIPGIFSMERMNPFIMMDYNSKFYFAPTNKPRGVDVHPHRGFETVTISYKGSIAHHDSTGNHGIIGEGDVQWMTAASGILHKEYHEEKFSQTGGEFQMIQLWVNLPAKDKMSSPKYQSIHRQSIPKLILSDHISEIGVIAGQHKHIKGIASTFSPVHIINVKLQKGMMETFEFPAEYNTSLLVVEGRILVNKSDLIPTNHFVLFKNDGARIEIEGIEDCLVFIISGAPIPEAIAAHGPFVMNTRQELMDAVDDYNQGKFGILES